MNYWKILLEKQRERGKKGLTLPFLLGSQNYLPTDQPRQDIKDIIIDMVNNNSFETCIRYCADTYALIFEIRNPSNSTMYPIFKGCQQQSLSVSLGNNDLGESVEKIIENLKNKYQKKIDLNEYSVRPSDEERGAVWENFSDKEELFITDCFKLI